MIPFRIQKKQSKVPRLMSSKIYDEVTDFEVCGSTKNEKIEKETLFFLQIQKHIYHSLGVKKW